MRSTGKLDSNGNLIHEGDKVIYCWGNINGNPCFKIHTITVRDAHMMNNGQIHDDGGGIIFCLGRSYNFWDGKDVERISEKYISEINIPEDIHFFFYENKKAVRLTDQHFL